MTDSNSSEPSQLIEKLYGDLNVDFTFQARLNLIENLAVLAELGTKIGIPQEDYWEPYSSSLLEERDRLDRKGYMLVTVDPITNNCLSIRDTQHKIAAAFTQFSPEAHGQLLGLQLLLLFVLTKSAANVKEFIDEIRLSGSKRNQRFDVLSRLPSVMDSDSSYLTHLVQALSTQRNHYLTDLQRKFVLVIERLLDLVQSLSPDSTLDEPSKLIDIWKIDVRTLRPLPGDEPADKGEVFQLLGGDGLSDEPDVNSNWSYIPEEPEENTAANYEEDTAAEARRTRYWLRNAANRSINDEILLSPLEKMVLSRYLRGNINSSCPSERVSIALMVGLIYATGLDIVSLLAAKIGEDALFSPVGSYRKTLPKLKREADAGDSMTVSLLLPTVLREWFARQTQQHGRVRTLGEVLGLTTDAALTAIKDSLRDIRANGRFRIKLPRIQSGLSAELSARTRNSAITYLLAYSDAHEPPTLLYYQRVTSAMLVEAYQEVIENMFPEH